MHGLYNTIKYYHSHKSLNDANLFIANKHTRYTHTNTSPTSHNILYMYSSQIIQVACMYFFLTLLCMYIVVYGVDAERILDVHCTFHMSIADHLEIVLFIMRDSLTLVSKYKH
jgi:hypothetical protein